MHAVYATRGNIDAVNSINEFLKTQKFLIPFTDKDGKSYTQAIAGNLQPIQLWSYVFPKEARDAVLTTLGFTQANQERWYGTSFKQRMIWASLRKALHCEPIPTDIKTDRELWLDQDAKKGVSFMPIGVKHDLTITNPEGLTFEGI